MNNAVFRKAMGNDSNKNKKSRGAKACVIKQKLIFEDWNRCLEATQLENKINQLTN